MALPIDRSGRPRSHSLGSSFSFQEQSETERTKILKESLERSRCQNQKLVRVITEQAETIKRLEEEISGLRADLEATRIPGSPRTQLEVTKIIIAKQEGTIRVLTRSLGHREAQAARILAEISARLELLAQQRTPDLERGSVGSTSSSEELTPRYTDRD